MKKLFSITCKYLLILIFMTYHENIFAQNELQIKIGLETPIDEMHWVYKPTLGHSIEWSKIFDNDYSIGLGIGYMNYKAKADTFYYLLDSTTYGKVRYSDYSVFQLYVPMKKIYNLNKKIEWFWGWDVGYFFVIYEMHDSNPFISSHQYVKEGKGAVCFKTGFNIHISDKLGFNIQSRINCFFSTGSSNKNSSTYNSNLGQVNTSLSNSLGLYYRF